MSNFQKIILPVTLYIAFALNFSHHAEGGWYEDYDEALKAAKHEGKYILADFTGSDWCGWCIKLNEEVFSQPAFTAWAEDNVILLELDYPRSKPQSQKIKAKNQELLTKYGVGGYPTILFLNPDGDVVGKYGYKQGGPEPWVAYAQSVLDQQPALKTKKKSQAEEKDNAPYVASNGAAPEVISEPTTIIYLKNGSILKGDIIIEDDGIFVNQGSVKIFIENEKIDNIVPN